MKKAARRKRFIHAGFSFRSATPPVEELERLFNVADWIRYDDSCWIIYSSQPLRAWRDKIKKVVDGEASFFLVEFSKFDQYAGWMPRWTWQWLTERLPK